jgi:hypothetical protein
MPTVDTEGFGSWLKRYFEAWRSNEPADVASLFAADAVYSYGPFREPTLGRDAIVEAWTSAPPQEDLEWDHEVLAVAGRRGIAHWSASFMGEGGVRVELDGILICDFDGDGRCTLHREWYDRREHRL